MPELPEVETVRKKLHQVLINKTILSVDVFYSKYDELKIINNEKILDINRKGKYLIFVLENYYMISHLRMEGKYFVKNNDEITKHDLVRFNFKDFKLVYNDVRKFGVFYLFKKDIDIYSVYPLTEVGDEPFKITNEKLQTELKHRTEAIKTALLDQSVIAGLGNIYVDEVLYLSKINPFRKANSIDDKEVDDIIKNSITVLNKAIEAGGTTIRSFKSLDEIGHFQLSLKCHNRENERCECCNNIIIKDKCNGRGTYYCPSCQRLYKIKKIYAITGTFSSGKSTSLSIIKDLGFDTYSSDDIYNELFINSKEMKRELKNRLNVTTKEEIKRLVFDNKENNDILMDITHKYVIKEIFKRIDESDSLYAFVEVPLLFEGNFDRTFDEVIDIYESDQVASKLIKAKGYTILDAKKRYDSQLSKEYKKDHSNRVVLNNGTKEDLKNNIIKVLKEMEVI